MILLFGLIIVIEFYFTTGFYFNEAIYLTIYRTKKNIYLSVKSDLLIFKLLMNITKKIALPKRYGNL